MERLKLLLADIFKIDKDIINENTSPENVETWDSFNSLLLATRLEDEFKIKFTMEEIQNIKSVGDIVKILKKHRMELRNEN